MATCFRRPSSLCSFFFFFILFSFLAQYGFSTGAENSSYTETCENLSFGVIIDYSSRAGKEQKTAMEMALEDFYVQLNCSRPSLLVRNSEGCPSRAAHAGTTLIKKHHARAIIGPGAWQEVVAVAEFMNNTGVPILSLSSEVPSWASLKWPFLVKAARSEHSQMKALAAIIQTWQWRKVNIIYEDNEPYTTGIVPYLISALEEINSEVNDLLPLAPLPLYHSVPRKLEGLANGQCRVFIVHTSAALAIIVLKEAKYLGMMNNESVWLTTTDITNYIDTLDASSIVSMQGVLGVRSFLPATTNKFSHFRSTFQSNFQKQYPEESHTDPGIFAARAYDAMWALSLAIGNAPTKDSPTGQDLLGNILNSSFNGLTGRFKFKEGTLGVDHIFEIVNVVGKKYKQIGYWAEGLGFSESIGKNSNYSDSMTVLGQIYWPNGPWSIPRGWHVPTNGKKLKIGVPISNSHKEFVYARNETPGGDFTVTGFSIDVFRATVKQLPYDLPYDLFPFTGTYDSLVQEVELKNFDAVVADTAIVSHRCEFAEFSQPYADSGLQMLIYVRPKRYERAWLFKKPFTTNMWTFTGIVNLYNGFVVWLIERNHNQAFRGSFLNQIGTMMSLAFTTLFSLQADRLHSNLSRMTMVVWLFVALVITSSFTASLTSFLTVEKLNPADVNIETLIRSGAKVGCDGNSFVVRYLQVLGFSPSNIKKVYSEDDYPQALMTGEIAAAFLEVPYIKVFLARHCNGFTTSKQIFKVGGFGYVFPKSSPYLPDISEAVLKVAESGTLRNLENSMIASNKCITPDTGNDGQESLGTNSFWGLFVVTTATSTLSLLLFLLRRARDNRYRHVVEAQQHHDPNIDEREMFAPDLEYAPR